MISLISCQFLAWGVGKNMEISCRAEGGLEIPISTLILSQQFWANLLCELQKAERLYLEPIAWDFAYSQEEGLWQSTRENCLFQVARFRATQ